MLLFLHSDLICARASKASCLRRSFMPLRTATGSPRPRRWQQQAAWRQAASWAQQRRWAFPTPWIGRQRDSRTRSGWRRRGRREGLRRSELGHSGAWYPPFGWCCPQLKRKPCHDDGGLVTDTYNRRLRMPQGQRPTPPGTSWSVAGTVGGGQRPRRYPGDPLRSHPRQLRSHERGDRKRRHAQWRHSRGGVVQQTEPSARGPP